MGNRLRQTVHTHRASVHQAAKLAAALLRVARVTAGLAESNGSLPPVYDSRYLQADCQERDQLRNHTLGNRAIEYGLPLPVLAQSIRGHIAVPERGSGQSGGPTTSYLQVPVKRHDLWIRHRRLKRLARQLVQILHKHARAVNSSR